MSAQPMQTPEPTEFDNVIELEDSEVIHQLSLWDDWMEGELDMV